ncbi:sugar porter family MFS transporter [Pseudoalteromonas piscicida]|uniref:sugar porter family MFS transporter n=1 Tax=Pseudoalteromonas piscicida TaxID=43662 RepID=UPI0030B5ADF1
MTGLTISSAVKYTLIVSLGGFIFGFDASVISGAIGFISEAFKLTAWQQGIVVSAPTLGGLIATLMAGPVADAIGRKRTLLMTACLYFVSAIGSALAPSFEALVLARFVGGMAFCSLMVAPMYIAEISLPEQRGRLVSVNQLNIVIGLVISYFTNYFLLQLSHSDVAWVTSWHIDTQTWRWMLGVEAIPALAWVLLLLLLPRSPRWLLMKHQTAEAKRALISLFGRSQAQQQFVSITAALPNAQLSSVSIASKLGRLFSKRMRIPLIVGVVLAVAQQVTGINVVFFYAPTIFEQSGIGTDAAFLQAIWIGLINVLFTIIALLTIDKIGRRPLLLTGLTGICLSMALCSWGFKQATYQLNDAGVIAIQQKTTNFPSQALTPIVGRTFHSDVEFNQALQQRLTADEYRQHKSSIFAQSITMPAKWVLFGISLFVASFAMSLGPVMWVMFSEIFPNAIRAVAISVVGVINNAASFTVQLVFPWELAYLGASTTFLLYSVFSIISFALVFLFVEETKGKTLEQLSEFCGETIDSKVG